METHSKAERFLLSIDDVFVIVVVDIVRFRMSSRQLGKGEREKQLKIHSYPVRLLQSSSIESERD